MYALMLLGKSKKRTFVPKQITPVYGQSFNY